ncbi:hypothetical protein L2E82_07491 [Cichorium intybus]|uniref:Uncharacterized protein n=1 Tax=Cichorium intybus TaxID=13427 RepID=A0ACB9G4D2_CICIN|nr:hypothetical protein L2E82_07491 [Cichorium intybus]
MQNESSPPDGNLSMERKGKCRRLEIYPWTTEKNAEDDCNNGNHGNLRENPSPVPNPSPSTPAIGRSRRKTITVSEFSGGEQILSCIDLQPILVI